MRRTTFPAAMSLLLLAFPGIGPAFGQTVQLENRNGLYLVPVQINGALTIDFAIDSGATQVTITADVASTLSRMGALAPEDYGDSANFRLADGTKLHATRVILRKIKVGTHEYSNVPAIVIPSSGAQLLGQSLLTRLGTWSIDNERHLLIIGSEPPVDPSAPKDLDTALVRATEVMEGHCAPPAAPLSVDANFATVPMMRDAIAAFKSFQAAADDYQRCVVRRLAELKDEASHKSPRQPIDPLLAEGVTGLIDKNQRLKEQVGGDLNQQIFAYKARAEAQAIH